MDCSPPGSSVHGISQARILEWVAVAFSRGSSRPRDRTHVSCIGRWFFYCRAATRPLYKTKTQSLSDQLEVTPLRSFPTADLMGFPPGRVVSCSTVTRGWRYLLFYFYLFHLIFIIYFLQLFLGFAFSSFLNLFFFFYISKSSNKE